MYTGGINMRPSLFRSIRGGFTLIELLIVVAIIAILAAIAVPNFLEAQVRSKVSRCKADQRSMATAMEAYTVDNNRCSPTFNSTTIPLPWGAVGDAQLPDGRLNRWHWLTTPVAYITSAFMDPFVPQEPTPNDRVMVIQSPPALAQTDLSAANPGMNWIGDPRVIWKDETWRFTEPLWVCISRGPDRDFDVLDPEKNAFGIQMYDPTNGTVSDGDIVRPRQ
jgi:prepilin-type N-terminal cleavage/methylation domain-containing protein